MHLTRQLNRKLSLTLRRCYLTRRLDGRPFRPPNHLAIACSLLGKCVRMRQKAARENPHLFGPKASRYYRDTLVMEQEQRERNAALERVYGPTPKDAPPHPSVWQERYKIRTERMPIFRKWFKEKYGK